MTIRHIGHESVIGDIRLSEFGQAAEVTEAAYLEAARKVPILPDEEFQKIGFTPEELEEYRFPGPRAECSEAFAEKWKAARIRLHELRAELSAGKE